MEEHCCRERGKVGHKKVKAMKKNPSVASGGELVLDAPVETPYPTRLKSLDDLRDALVQMPTETFRRHKNALWDDFDHWVRTCLGRPDLADAILTADEPGEMLRKLERARRTPGDP